MESRWVYKFKSQQQRQSVLASKSSLATVDSYFDAVVYIANKTGALSRVRNNGGKYSTSGFAEQLLGDRNNDPSNDSNSFISPSKNSGYTKGSDSIYCRTITKNEKNYSQFFYCWKLQGKKRTKYIPKRLVSQVQQAIEQKRAVVEILKLLGDMKASPSNNSSNSPSNDPSNVISLSKNSPKLLGDMKASPSNSPSNDSSSVISPSKNSPELLGDIEASPSNSPSNNSSNVISPCAHNTHLFTGCLTLVDTTHKLVQEF